MRELKQFRTAAVSGSDCDSFVGFISEDSASLFTKDYFLYKNFIIRLVRPRSPRSDRQCAAW